MNTPITVTVKPANIGWSLAGGGVALAGAGTAFISGPWGAAAGLAIAALGYAIEEAAPNDIVFTRPFGYDDYADAVRRQYAINSGTAPATTNHWRVANSDFANIPVNTLTSAANAASDMTYSMNSGHMQGKIIISRPKVMRYWHAEQYSSKGYDGPVNYETIEEEAPVYVPLVSVNGAGQ